MQHGCNMTGTIKAEWTEQIVEWASAKPHIAEVFLFGSRVKGDHAADSDLDIALRIDGMGETPLTVWMFEGREWAAELDAMLDVRVDLQMVDEGDTVVLPAVREHGHRIYFRNSLHKS